MIKASELRLGNIVSYQGFYQEVRLNEIEEQQFVNDGILHENHGNFGIPITDDILISSGFLLYRNQLDPLGPPIFGFDTFMLAKQTDGYCYVPCKRAKIQYVHQLQNLYLALYGEELNIVL